MEEGRRRPAPHGLLLRSPMDDDCLDDDGMVTDERSRGERLDGYWLSLWGR